MMMTIRMDNSANNTQWMRSNGESESAPKNTMCIMSHYCHSIAIYIFWSKYKNHTLQLRAYTTAMCVALDFTIRIKSFAHDAHADTTFRYSRLNQNEHTIQRMNFQGKSDFHVDGMNAAAWMNLKQWTSEWTRKHRTTERTRVDSHFPFSHLLDNKRNDCAFCRCLAIWVAATWTSILLAENRDNMLYPIWNQSKDAFFFGSLWRFCWNSIQVKLDFVCVCTFDVHFLCTRKIWSGTQKKLSMKNEQNCYNWIEIE